MSTLIPCFKYPTDSLRAWPNEPDLLAVQIKDYTGHSTVFLNVDGAVLLAQELAAFLRANVERDELVDEESSPPIQTRTSSRRRPVLRHD